MPLFEEVFEDVYQFWSINLTKKMVVLQCMVIRQVRHHSARLMNNLLKYSPQLYIETNLDFRT